MQRLAIFFLFFQCSISCVWAMDAPYKRRVNLTYTSNVRQTNIGGEYIAYRDKQGNLYNGIRWYKSGVFYIEEGPVTKIALKSRSVSGQEGNNDLFDLGNSNGGPLSITNLRFRDVSSLESFLQYAKRKRLVVSNQQTLKLDLNDLNSHSFDVLLPFFELHSYDATSLSRAMAKGLGFYDDAKLSKGFMRWHGNIVRKFDERKNIRPLVENFADTFALTAEIFLSDIGKFATRRIKILSKAHRDFLGYISRKNTSYDKLLLSRINDLGIEYEVVSNNALPIDHMELVFD